jgi:dTDP-4-dehydrorhamnose reductase
MIELVVQNKPIGTYNIGSRNGMSKADFAFAFAKCLKLPTHNMKRIESSKAKFFTTYRPRNMLMNISKFENAIGVRLPHLNYIIQEIAKDYYEIA